jgi:hypothetical protein
MALARKIDDIEFYFVPNQQFIICATYPNYEKFLPFFEKKDSDLSMDTCTVNGVQSPLQNDDWVEQRLDYTKWIESVFKKLDAPISKVYKAENNITAWTVDYADGGWQAGHFHSTDRMHQQNKRFITTVLFFDKIEPTIDNNWNGCLYTVLQNPEGYTYDHKFHPTPGKVIIMDDRVWHGTYPTQERRRVFVSDFEID